MNESYNILLEKFKIISKQEWIKGINNTSNSVGLTLENLLNKKTDSLFFPDYKGIEIKCTQRYSRYPITLFTLSFDGPSFYEMNKLVNTYGIHDKEFKNKRILMSFLKAGKKILINKKYFFELKIDKQDKKIYINIFDKNQNLLEKGPYIEYETIKKRLEIKLSNLVLIHASKKEIDGNKYFRYYKCSFYKLKDFDTFLNLLEKQIIIVDLVGRVSRSTSRNGRQSNKNMVFQIPKDSIDLLFKKISEYNYDDNGFFKL